MERYLKSLLYKALDKKIVLLSGPRQVGKTTLAKSLYADFDYLNYDDDIHRERMLKRLWRRDVSCVIFDEIHKMKDWKRWLKGVYDTEGNKPHILVTGSARMDALSKVGDSLAGRYIHFRLYPLDIQELLVCFSSDTKAISNQLLHYGGFPEPFLAANIDEYRVWQKTHMDIMLRQDFLDLYAVRSIKSIEIILQLLVPRIASSISYTNLALDLHVDHNTVKKWLLSLENIYAVFRVTPYHHNIARSLLKEPKFYFYDIGRVKDMGARIENLVALSLLKQLHFLEDTKGIDAHLHYLRTKDGKEVDFLVVIDNFPVLAIEVKTSDANISSGLKHFKKFLPETEMLQLVLELQDEFDTQDGIKVRKLTSYLESLGDHLQNLLNR